MNNISNVNGCTNCMACVNACNTGAIELKKEGLFYKLKIDNDKCVNCGICLKSCPIENFKPNLNVISAYGGWTKDNQVLSKSSSGGAFSTFANYIIKQGGVVFGAAYSDDFKEVLFKNTDETELDGLMRSKYVESITGNSFQKVKKYLDANRKVLFCATPCQVAGLKYYLSCEYDNLLTIDFACGGLTSHKLYEQHIENLEKKYKSKTIDVNFRPGTFGWRQYAFKVSFENGKKYEVPSQFDSYVYSFMYSRMGNRENCLNCKFRETHYSDIIIADFWKWDSCSNLVNKETGISLILVNSEKGQNILNEISPQMKLENLDIEKAKYNCISFPKPTEEFKNQRDRYLQSCESIGVNETAKKFGMRHGLIGLIAKKRIIFRGRLNESKK